MCVAVKANLCFRLLCRIDQSIKTVGFYTEKMAVGYKKREAPRVKTRESGARHEKSQFPQTA